MATRTSTITARAWFTSIFIFFFGRGLLNASWASRGPDVQSMLHISIAQMGILAAVFSAGAVLGVLVAGRLITVYGSRRVSLVGFLVMTAGLAATVSAVAGGSFPLPWSVFSFLVSRLAPSTSCPMWRQVNWIAPQAETVFPCCTAGIRSGFSSERP